MMRYAFQHISLRDAAYAMQLPRRLSELHRRAAVAIEALHSDDLAPYYADLAYHYGQAGLVGQERHFAILAGERAAARFDHAEAGRWFTRALELTPAGDRAARYDLLMARTQVYDLQGRRQAQGRDLDTLKELATALNDPRREAEVALERARYAENVSDYGTAIEAIQEAIRLAQQGGQDDLEARGYALWGKILRTRDTEKAEQVLQRALRLARQAGIPWVEADARGSLAIVCWYRGDFEQAQVHMEQARQRYHEIGDRKGEAAVLGNLGIMLRNRGEFARAQDCCRQALAIFRQIGDRLGEGTALNNLGALYRGQGEYVQARRHFREALRIREQVGDRRGVNLILNSLGLVALRLGDEAEARALLERSLESAREIQDLYGESLALSNLALLEHRLGDDRAALRYSERAVGLARRTGDESIEAEGLLHAGHAWLGLGRPDEAGPAYRQALERMERLGLQPLCVDARVGLARVALIEGDIDEARAHVEAVLSIIAGGSVAGVEAPLRAYQTCYEVLRAYDDARAAGCLAAAQRLLQERAGQ